MAEANPNEVERLEWVPVDRVRGLLRVGEVDGLSLTSLLWALPNGYAISDEEHRHQELLAALRARA